MDKREIIKEWRRAIKAAETPGDLYDCALEILGEWEHS